jgi:MraZ protein
MVGAAMEKAGRAEMALFLSTYLNKIDRKGRVSVPAPFRASLGLVPGGAQVGSFAGYPKASGRQIVGCRQERMERWIAEFEAADEGSERYEELAVLLQSVREIAIDGEGRAVLPAQWLTFIGASDEVAFVGQGRDFLICHPDLPTQRAERLVQRKGGDAAFTRAAVVGRA